MGGWCQVQRSSTGNVSAPKELNKGVEEQV